MSGVGLRAPHGKPKTASHQRLSRTGWALVGEGVPFANTVLTLLVRAPKPPLSCGYSYQVITEHDGVLPSFVAKVCPRCVHGAALPNWNVRYVTRLESPRRGATLSLVSGGNSAVPAREAATEIVALRVFNHADRNGLPVTRRMVDERLAELAGHAAGCGCGVCSLLPLAAPSRIYWTASRWQVSINCTRARMTS